MSNYNQELPKKLSNLEINREEKDKEIEKCSLITNKIDDIFFNYKENSEEERNIKIIKNQKKEGIIRKVIKKIIKFVL